MEKFEHQEEPQSIETLLREKGELGWKYEGTKSLYIMDFRGGMSDPVKVEFNNEKGIRAEYETEKLDVDIVPVPGERVLVFTRKKDHFS